MFNGIRIVENTFTKEELETLSGWAYALSKVDGLQTEEDFKLKEKIEELAK